MAHHGIGLDLFVTQGGIWSLNRVLDAARHTPHGMLCALALGTPGATRVVAQWNGVPDVVDAADLSPADATPEMTDALRQVADSVTGIMWGTGQTLLFLDSKGWGTALFVEPASWAAPPARILPSLGMVFAPYLYASAHVHLAQQKELDTMGQRLAMFAGTTAQVLGTALPPLVIDRTICTI
jgi:hypothetical protein